VDLLLKSKNIGLDQDKVEGNLPIAARQIWWYSRFEASVELGGLGNVCSLRSIFLSKALEASESALKSLAFPPRF
jgi:hypothetical protein